MARIPINLKTGTVDSSQVVLGIDLGTTNSLIAYMVDGRPLALKGSSDQAVVPSVIHFKEDGSILVGKDATEQLLLDSKNTIYSVKRLLGRSYKDIVANHSQLGYEIIDSDEMELVKIKVKDTYYSPIELSSFILRELKERAEIELNQTIQKVVITVPAYFNDSQRQATRDAGKLAGLDVLRIINEPTAASLAYGIGLDKSEQKTIAVYDLGGGTFDISILQIEDGVFEVLSTNGDTFLGGDDFDQAIVRYWMQQLGLSDQDVQNNKNLSQTLRLEAERAKVYLSSNDEFTSTINSQQITISATYFSQLIKHLIDRTIKKCAQAVVDSGLYKSEIDQVILVGGSTRVPSVKEQVTQFFATQINDQIDPDQAVALGAAIQADILAGNQKDLLLLDITPLSLGLETLGGLMDFIIPRNSKIPTVATKQYSTSVDGQVNLKIAVYQGEREFVQDNRKLGEFILSGIPAMPAGIPKVEIKFIVDADGILKVSANELRSNSAQSIEIKPTYGLSDQDVEQMLADALQHATTDIEDRALRETINEAEQLVLQSKKFINQNKEDISAQEVELLQTRIKQLDDLLDSNDKDKIQIAMDTLNDTSRPMVERAMDQTISSALKNRSIND